MKKKNVPRYRRNAMGRNVEEREGKEGKSQLTRGGEQATRGGGSGTKFQKGKEGNEKTRPLRGSLQ